MNKDTIKLDNNTYAVINELGSTRVVSTINSNDQEIMKIILLKENDIETIEKKINQYKKQLSSTKIDSIFSNTLDILTLGFILLMIALIKPTTTIDLLPIALTCPIAILIVKLFNIGIYGTRKKRKKLKAEAEYEIPNLEQILETTTKELEKIKEETVFTELTNINDKSSSSKYVYKYDPNNCNIEDLTKEEKQKEIHILKLVK